MTSLIFGSIYMAHQGIMLHHRSKQRQKNYERWEDLRDEYDAQKKITRQSQSLDLQRTGTWDPQANYSGEYTANEERPILTLRDQQEANDARLSWRPQEQWEPSHRTSSNPFEIAPQRTSSVPAIPPHMQAQYMAQSQSHSQIQPQYTAQPQVQPQYTAQPQVQPQYTAQPQLQPQPTAQSPYHPPITHTQSTPSAYWQSRGEIKPQKTGAVWDEGLPAPLPVSRRSFEDYQYPHLRRGSAPVQQPSSIPTSQQPSRNGSAAPSRTSTPFQAQNRTSSLSANSIDDLSAKIATISVEPVQSHVPGGRMAELIERGY